MKKHILNEDISFYIEETGKPKVLFLHGFNSGTFFINPIKKLERNYDIIIFDYPGCNLSTNNNDISIEYYQEITTAILDELNLKELTIVAHSLGAASAIKNINHPSINRVVLLAPFNPFILEETSEEKTRRMLLPKTYEDAYESLGHLAQNKDKEEYFKNIERSANAYFKNVAPKLSMFHNLVDNQIANLSYLKSIESKINPLAVDVSIIIGDKDFFTPLNSVLKYAKCLNISNVIVLKDTGHSLVYERSNEINNFLCHLF